MEMESFGEIEKGGEGGRQKANEIARDIRRVGARISPSVQAGLKPGVCCILIFGMACIVSNVTTTKT